MKKRKIRPILERFMEKINNHNPNECWEWIGTIRKNGYGQITITNNLDRNQKAVLAHRVSFELFKGEIPDGHCVCHACDNPLCVNPDHLFSGTQAENIRDCISKGRKVNQNKNKTHCKRGHEFSPKNTGINGSKRYCITCHRTKALERYYKIKKTVSTNSTKEVM